MKLAGMVARLGPDRLAGQITLLILGAIVTFQTIVLVAFHLLDVEGRRHIVDQTDFVASIILAVDAAPMEERQHLLSEFAHAVPFANIHIEGERPQAVALDNWEFANEIRAIHSDLWEKAEVFAASAPDGRNSGVLAVGLRKGGYALISIYQHRKPPRSVWRWFWQPEPGTPFFLTPWALSAILFFLCTTILVVWASDGIVAPLVKLAKHAEQFPDRGEGDELLAERGPTEVRELTRSINRMQDRIRTMIAARSQVLAAVSHDLKTIITRLNLRTELVSEPHLRDKMLHDISLMDAMLRKNLEHLRAESDRADYSLIDIDSVLQTVADQFVDLGYRVRYRGGDRYMILGSLTEMQRVFNNLVENAIHHAGAVEIEARQTGVDRLQIDVIDNGPGIPDDQKATIFEPFVRGEPGRTISNHSGFGLGLSIVRSLVEHHGGAVALLDHKPHGLIVRVVLPLQNGVVASS
ncbi:MAG: HAMP domain-containing protein [Hyphomicrobiales bacterium]|nr:MAG: HAMP domain-containing protein [Hyphomicrobiales bacterium]